MKVFWFILVLLIAAGVGFVALGPAKNRRDSAELVRRPKSPEGTTVPRETTSPAPDTSAPSAPQAANPRHPEPPPGYPDPDSIADALISGEWSEFKPPAPIPASPTAASASKPAETPAAQPATTTPASGTASTSDKGYTVAKGTIATQDNGTILVNEKHVIRGKGTAESPYEITWDLLTTAEHTFNPRGGSRKIPEGIAMLDGKIVRIKGFVAFPLYVQEPTEVLAMLNQWDGCCIGVPPTPYDAIEVRLAKAIKGNDRFANSGVVEGTFGVKPYVTGNWLVGLYVIDGAVLKPDGFGSGPATHGGQ